jgi:hypothetical protein
MDTHDTRPPTTVKLRIRQSLSSYAPTLYQPESSRSGVPTPRVLTPCSESQLLGSLVHSLQDLGRCTHSTPPLLGQGASTPPKLRIRSSPPSGERPPSEASVPATKIAVYSPTTETTDGVSPSHILPVSTAGHSTPVKLRIPPPPPSPRTFDSLSPVKDRIPGQWYLYDGDPVRWDGKGLKCIHDKKRSECKECKGSGICEHDKRRSGCKECKGSQICEHDKHRSDCKECKGSGICEHDKHRSTCKNI